MYEMGMDLSYRLRTVIGYKAIYSLVGEAIGYLLIDFRRSDYLSLVSSLIKIMQVRPMDFIGHLLPIQLFVCKVKIQLANCVFSTWNISFILG